jgi:hypothetical protein
MQKFLTEAENLCQVLLLLKATLVLCAVAVLHVHYTFPDKKTFNNMMFRI